MKVTVYMLIQTDVNMAGPVAAAARELPGVLTADDVTGPYDVIVKAEAPSLDDLGKMVIGKVQQIPGITRTLTCPVISY